MRVTILPRDGLVAIDGISFEKLDLSFIPSEVHALQWYETFGEIEYKDERGCMVRNEEISSLDQFQYFDQAYQLWQEAKAELDAKVALYEKMMTEAAQAALAAQAETATPPVQ